MVKNNVNILLWLRESNQPATSLSCGTIALVVLLFPLLIGDHRVPDFTRL